MNNLGNRPSPGRFAVPDASNAAPALWTAPVLWRFILQPRSRLANPERTPARRSIRTSVFGLPSGFGLRISDLGRGRWVLRFGYARFPAKLSTHLAATLLGLLTCLTIPACKQSSDVSDTVEQRQKAAQKSIARA